MTSLQPWTIALILATGTLAGIINTLAGGGSMLTVPMLIFLGLPPATANGTNRIAIEVQNILAVLGFKKKGVADWKLSLKLAIPVTVGAIIGSSIAVDIPDSVFRQVLAVMMLFVLGLILWNPTRRLKQLEVPMTRVRWVAAALALFCVGLYGGFIQSGVGFMFIATLVSVMGMDLVTTNSHKVFIVGVYTLFSIAVFAMNGKINWSLGLILAVGNGLGGWLGSHIAVSKGEKWVRAVLVVAVLAMALRLSGLVPGWS